jgi:K+-sensing histidine kinase KdpD
MARSGHVANAFAGLRQWVRTVFQTGERLTLRGRPRLGDGCFDEVLRMLERDAWLKDKMLDELREAERVGEGTVLRRTSQVDFAELIRSIAESLAPVARTKQVTVRVRCAATSVLIPSDAKDLTHVVGHVLACGIAACARQGVVDCQLFVDAHWVRLLVRAPVSDEGLAGLSHVLDSSSQANSERELADWDHLSLTTVRALVDLHGGNLRMEILDSHGIFTVTLPGVRPVPGGDQGTTLP